MAGGLVVVAIAVAGLLMMHGFEGALASVAEVSHSDHGSPQGGADHDLLGLCLFVVTVVGLGFAMSLHKPGSTVRGPTSRSAGWRSTPLNRVHGRVRLAHLCVLRL